jgi:transcriptional regulator with XRE-family HTH domain
VKRKNPKEILAENIRRLRKSTGLSQEELADRAGLHRTYISSIERCERNVSLENIFVLAVALGVEPAVLVTAVKDGGPTDGL